MERFSPSTVLHYCMKAHLLPGSRSSTASTLLRSCVSAASAALIHFNLLVLTGRTHNVWHGANLKVAI